MPPRISERQAAYAAIGRIVFERYRKAAHHIVQLAVEAGRLPRANSVPCVDCHNPAAVYDHRTYDFPVTVAAVCDSCNQKRGMADLGKDRICRDLHPYWGGDDYLKFTECE